MTRRNQVFKWLVYTLGLLLVWVLDVHILGRLPVLGTVPVLLPVAAATVAVLEGGAAGAGFGLGTGLLWEISALDSGGWAVIFLAVCGLLCGSAAQFALTQGFIGCMICSAAVMAALECIHLLVGLFTQLAPPALLVEVAVKELVWSLVWAPAVYLIFRAIFRRVGRDRLAN